MRDAEALALSRRSAQAVDTAVTLLHSNSGYGGAAHGTVHACGAFASASALRSALAFLRAQHTTAHADAAVRAPALRAGATGR